MQTDIIKIRTFILADVHGEYDKLMSCLKQVNFDYENDILIQLGDVVDRGPKTYECVEELLKIKNLVAIRGNHDDEFRKAIISGDLMLNMLYNQGGRETMLSYIRNGAENNPSKIPQTHKDFFNNQLPYYIKDNNLFIHGGFNRHQLLNDQNEFIFYWTRDLWLEAMSYESMKDKSYPFKMIEKFNHVYIGHTPVNLWGYDKPITCANITNLDTGSGKNGLLTILNLETKEYFQVSK